ncbi:UNVERIFIED_CONTAM: hypothetical protein Sradi_4474300 [Sesamum radiatum]|uniref:Uncharacterized protein n=1 Tax=Sesamum radiatum TaxID=300843 RepID=A0AAW2N7T0_SESRA
MQNQKSPHSFRVREWPCFFKWLNLRKEVLPVNEGIHYSRLGSHCCALGEESNRKNGLFGCALLKRDSNFPGGLQMLKGECRSLMRIVAADIGCRCPRGDICDVSK